MIGKIFSGKRIARVFFLALPLVLFLISLSIGSYAISPRGLLNTVMSLFSPSSYPGVPEAYRDILLQIRLPRLLLAAATPSSVALCAKSGGPVTSPTA